MTVKKWRGRAAFGAGPVGGQVLGPNRRRSSDSVLTHPKGAAGCGARGIGLAARLRIHYCQVPSSALLIDTENIFPTRFI